MHADPLYRNAVFQVASQFNMLEMIGPGVTPEQGVTRYIHDRTQGPACAIAAGAATIYRNYFMPFGDASGQTTSRQVNGLADLAEKLGALMQQDPTRLVPMQNGYALPDAATLQKISALIEGMDDDTRGELRSLLRIGWHTDVQVTDSSESDPVVVSQVFCSALPVSYSTAEPKTWEPFARLVLEAAYEATLLCGLENAARGKSNIILLTRLGGGAFGNSDEWINEAMVRSLSLFQDCDLDVHLVSFGHVDPAMSHVAESCQAFG
jgi:hypothetical protein